MYIYKDGKQIMIDLKTFEYCEIFVITFFTYYRVLNKLTIWTCNIIKRKWRVYAAKTLTSENNYPFGYKII